MTSGALRSVAIAGGLSAFALALGYMLATLSLSTMSGGLERAGQTSPAAIAPNAMYEGLVDVVSQTGPDAFTGVQIVKQDGAYRRTETAVGFRVDAGTPFVMGQRADLHPGAIVQVRGPAIDGQIDAERIVILTPNIRIE